MLSMSALGGEADIANAGKCPLMTKADLLPRTGRLANKVNREVLACLILGGDWRTGPTPKLSY